MVRTILCLWLVGNGAAVDDPAAEIAALGGRCIRDDAGETIGVDLSDVWLTDDDLAKLARLPRLEGINLAFTRITDRGLEYLAPLENVQAYSTSTTRSR